MTQNEIAVDDRSIPVGLDAEQCWQAVANRDAASDGKFYYGVMTTGIYCRPGCRARTARRENVRFYASPAEAERDGLRACLRCRPLTLSGNDSARHRILALCRYIEEHADSLVTLSDLSREAKLSQFHLQRTFKAVMGVSPKQYLDNLRLRNFKTILRSGGQQTPQDVTGAIFEAGFGSLSRLYEKTGTQLGMTPMEYRAGARGVEISYGSASTPLGLMLVGATDRGLCFLQFGESEAQLREALAAEYPSARLEALPDPVPDQFREWIDSLNRYLEGQEPDLLLPVHVRATSFQMKVWKYLQSIPAGKVESYQEVAQGIGQPRAARAVARACAANQVALAIPCHRVIRGSGELGGYRWGLERKRTLIDNERRLRARR
jgi:AraC family transcriptional regulator, regulatory protein of adaptative response / methylated-DNA-[protein]-cysteine methyltransferase